MRVVLTFFYPCTCGYMPIYHYRDGWALLQQPRRLFYRVYCPYHTACSGAIFLRLQPANRSLFLHHLGLHCCQLLFRELDKAIYPLPGCPPRPSRPRDRRGQLAGCKPLHNGGVQRHPSLVFPPNRPLSSFLRAALETGTLEYQVSALQSASFQLLK